MLTSILTTPVTLVPLLLCLGSAIVLGILTSLLFTRGERHSAGFSLTLALLPMMVTVIIMLVNGNIGAGVAVAGAFTLVRFRSMPGTAKEIAAIFTEMALGLALGMGYVCVATLLFVLTAAVLMALTTVHFGETANQKQMKIVVPENVDYNEIFNEVFASHGVKAELIRVRTTNMGTLIELTYVLTLRENQVPKAFLDDLRVRNSNLNIVIGPVDTGDTL